MALFLRMPHVAYEGWVRLFGGCQAGGRLVRNSNANQIEMELQRKVGDVVRVISINFRTKEEKYEFQICRKDSVTFSGIIVRHPSNCSC